MSRYVAAPPHSGRGSLWHAVWVPAKGLNAPWGAPPVSRPGRGAIVHVSYWMAQAECGLLVSPVYAGTEHGHDWGRFPEADKCLRCVRAVSRSLTLVETA